MAAVMAAIPASFGCRWSPLSKSGRSRSGSAGSRLPAVRRVRRDVGGAATAWCALQPEQVAGIMPLEEPDLLAKEMKQFFRQTLG
jgi:hypothetical protein